MDAVIQRIGALAAEVDYAKLGPETVNAVRRHFIDAVGCALAGSNEAVAAAARAAAAESVPRHPTTMLLGGTSTAEMAAFANGVAIRCLDLNDTYVSAGGVGHPSDYIGAVLAAAEEADADGPAFIEGVVAAYEVFCRLTDATQYRVTAWDHVSNGVIAAAVGAAKVWRLSEDQTQQAIAMAAVANLALHQTRIGTVSMWKGCASANACRNGIFAARMASLGVTGPAEAFSGPAGIARVTATDFDLDLLRSEPGRPAILACHLKRYPAGFFSQSAIDAARQIHEVLAADTEVSDILLGTFPFGKAVMAGDDEKWHPETRESADHSLPFLIAAALHDGDVTVETFSRNPLVGPEIRSLLDTLRVEEDPESAAAWPGEARNTLTVTGRDGWTKTVVVHDYYGHSRNPMSDESVSEKFLAGGKEVLPEQQLSGLLDRLWAVDRWTTCRAALSVDPESARPA